MATLKQHARKLLQHVKIDAKSYRALNTLAIELNKQDCSRHRPYTEIPGPKPIPLLGNTWRFLPFIGTINIFHIARTTYRVRGIISLAFKTHVFDDVYLIANIMWITHVKIKLTKYIY